MIRSFIPPNTVLMRFRGIIMLLPALFFGLYACCGRVMPPVQLPAFMQNSVWRVIISRSGEGMFEGLMIIGGMSGDRQNGGLSCSLVDSTGITLLSLVSSKNGLEVKDAMPPFDEKRISGYIAQDMELMLSCADLTPEHCVVRGMCSVEEYLCDSRDVSSDTRCLRGGAGPFYNWMMCGTFTVGQGVSQDAVLNQIIIIRPLSGMEMRLERLE